MVRHACLCHPHPPLCPAAPLDGVGVRVFVRPPVSLRPSLPTSGVKIVGRLVAARPVIDVSAAPSASGTARPMGGTRALAGSDIKYQSRRMAYIAAKRDMMTENAPRGERAASDSAGLVSSGAVRAGAVGVVAVSLAGISSRA